MNIFELYGKIGIDSKDAENKIKSIGDKAKGLGSKLGGMATGVAKVGAGIAVGLGTAAVGAGVAIANMTDDFNKSLNGLAAATGATDAEMEKLGQTMKGVYANNFGDSMEDVALAISDVKQQMSGITDEQLQKVTESAILLKDTFDYDIGESTRAADALMKQFGITSEEAFDLIAKGTQEGLNQNGDLLDSVNEYAVQFKDMGYSANDFFNILKSGGESGAFSIDKVGDAFKEFNIRMKDQSKASREALLALGPALGLGDTSGIGGDIDKDIEKYEKKVSTIMKKLEKTSDPDKRAAIIDEAKEFGELLNKSREAQKSVVDLEQALISGGDKGNKAIQEVFNAIGALQDPLKQNEIGVALFGTMWEDLGPDTILAMTQIEDKMDDVVGTMDRMNEIKYNSFGEAIQGIKRQLEVGLIDTIGVKLLPLMNTFSNFLRDNMPAIIEFIGNSVEFVGELIEKISSVFITAKDIISGTSEEASSTISNIIGTIKDFIMGFVDLLTMLYKENEDKIRIMIVMIKQIVESIMLIVKTIFDFLIKFINDNKELITTQIKAIINIITEVIDTFLRVISALLFAFTELFSGNFESFGQALEEAWFAVWYGIRDIFNGVLELIKVNATLFFTFIVDIVKSIFKLDIDTSEFVSKFTKPFVTIIDWFKEKWSGLTEIVAMPFKALDGVGEKIAGAAEGIKQKGAGFVSKTKEFLGFKSGTTNYPGGTSIVGEEGPELVELPKGSRIRNATNTKNILNKKAEIPQQNNINEEFNFSDNYFVVREEADIKKIAKELFEMTKKKNRGLGIV